MSVTSAPAPSPVQPPVAPGRVPPPPAPQAFDLPGFPDIPDLPATLRQVCLHVTVRAQWGHRRTETVYPAEAVLALAAGLASAAEQPNSKPVAQAMLTAEQFLRDLGSRLETRATELAGWHASLERWARDPAWVS